MSRCFPYPPPGYSLKSSSSEALIESIKLQREIEKAKAERKKEKKREKKEKKRDKDEKRKRNLSDFCHGDEGTLTDKKILKKDKIGKDLKGFSTEKTRENEAEQLERSDVTEERGQPVSSQNPCYSCDSTQNSNKRRRHSSHLDGSHNHGKIIRIRLPLQKPKELVALASEERSSSTSGRIVSPAQREYEMVHGSSQDDLCSTSTGTGIIDLQGVTHGPDKELSCSPSARTTTFAQDNMHTASVIKSFGNGMKRKGSLYKDLIETPLPPMQCFQAEFDDQEWLFGRKLKDKPSDKRRTAISYVSSCASSTLWPRAQYLPEVDTYALPFTVPY